MQSPVFGSVSADKDMSLDLLTFTTLDIRHSSFVPEVSPQFASSTRVSGGNVRFSYEVSHANTRGIFAQPRSPNYDYSLVVGTVEFISSGGIVLNAEPEMHFRGIFTVDSRTFEVDQLGRCVMVLTGTLEFFINGKLDQSGTFSTRFFQQDIINLTNSFGILASVTSSGVPADQGIDSIQVTVT